MRRKSHGTVLHKRDRVTTTEIQVDDQVEEAALAYIKDPARKEQPWCINVGFIAPHFPLVVPRRFWDMYPRDQIDMPDMPEGHLENMHPVYKRLRLMFGMTDFSEELVRRGRAGYYGLITYLDEKIGRLIDALEETGQLENTIIVHTSDHGEMNGEHGMWRKSNMYEASSPRASSSCLARAYPGWIARGTKYFARGSRGYHNRCRWRFDGISRLLMGIVSCR